MKKTMIAALLLSGLGLGGCGEVALQAAQFTLDVTPHAARAVRGGSVALTANVTRGLNLPVGVPVTVSLRDGAPGIGAKAVSVDADQTSARLQVDVAQGVAPGTYTLTFEGAGGLQPQTSSVSLQVQ